MTIRAITAVLTIAGSTFVLTGCNEAERQGTSSLLSSLNINDPVGKLSSPAPAVAYVTEVVEPPKVAWEKVCWLEPRRAGTYYEEVCENRVVNP
jgi:hypothetical protein